MATMPRLQVRFSTKLFITHLLAVFLVSGSAGTYFYFAAMGSLMQSLRSRLQNSAALLSHSLDARELEAIHGPGDVALDAYAANLDKLRRLRRSNPDIAFLYVMRQEGDRLVFVLDSDETERQALPGHPYDEATDLMRTGLNEPAVDAELVKDEWGVFLSGYAPLRNGEGRYLVGIDMRADEVGGKLAQLRMAGFMSLLASVLLALLFGLSLSRGLGRRIENMIHRCRRIAAGEFTPLVASPAHDEFDDLVAAFNTMGEDLGRARGEAARAIAGLQEARDQLETRVRDRTRELEKEIEKVQVLRGLLPICSSCKKIRDDQGYWQQVEHFVEAHSDARFTHGLCPSCAVRLYGDIVGAAATADGSSAPLR